MDRFIRTLVIVTTGILVVVGASPLRAEVLDPNKDYSEARLFGKGLTPSAVTQTHMNSPSGGDGTWIESKINVAKTALSAFARKFFGDDKPPVASSAPSAVVAAPMAPIRTALPAQPALNRSPAKIDNSISETLSFPGLSTSPTGVVKYDMAGSVEALPRLRLNKEERLSATHFALEAKAQKTLEAKILAPLHSPEILSAEEMARLTQATRPIGPVKNFASLSILRGKIDSSILEKLSLRAALQVEAQLKLAKYVPLTEDEYRFLSGLLLYQQGYQCAAAVGLFHSISEKKEWQGESNYYLAMCSKSLSLMTDFSERVRLVFESGDRFYSARLLKEISWDTPNVSSKAFGEALEKIMKVQEVVAEQKLEVLATAAAIIAESAAAGERFKTALEWAKKVPESHPRYLQAKFVEALSEYQAGSKKRALEIQEGLIRDPRAESSAREFQGLIALNLARMYFQEGQYKEAHKAFLTVNKDHPLWLQGLTEMGWAQLLSGDFEGAIGNMYSIQSPFFRAAYKPESYVIRTVGYLNLCQYGDAYRTLSILEKEYRAVLNKIDSFEKSAASFKDGRYSAVKHFLVEFNRPGRVESSEVDGLPTNVIREIARQKDFINLQRSLNRQIDEKAVYARIESDIDRSLKEAQARVNQSRRRIDQIRKDLARLRQQPNLEVNRLQWKASLESEMMRLNERFFSVDLFNEAKRAMGAYNRDVIAGADRRGTEMKRKMETVIANRLVKMRTDLSRALDNNELLRYEVFAASGENIRYQVAGGEKSNRVPASVIPKSKSLQWDFDGEYWEDEIGHYRSSLRNNCPIGESGRREQASLEGGGQ